MEFNKVEPIYTQIIEDIKLKIINGTYLPGQEIPSRRQLAKDLGVNPNTIQRAYREMEEKKLIVTSRGQGSFITSDQTIINSLKDEALSRVVSQSVEKLRSFGRSDHEIIELIQKFMKGEHRK
ncbi:GntR family transcriptional regulator [Bacillus carboniphilus]|uniref:GntR family transcriptional regulator n=1 Tax=Bacillus carboniphilus TaxID=86663 RepID=A0ABN0WNC4_9BACI